MLGKWQYLLLALSFPGHFILCFPCAKRCIWGRYKKGPSNNLCVNTTFMVLSGVWNSAYIQEKNPYCTKNLAQILNPDNDTGLRTSLSKCYRFVLLVLPVKTGFPLALIWQISAKEHKTQLSSLVATAD